MFAAVDWSLQRWYEEGRESDDNTDEGDGNNEVESDVDPERRTKCANAIYEEEEEEDEDDEEEEEEEKDVGDFGPKDNEGSPQEEEEEEREDDDLQTPAHDPVQELGEVGDDAEEVDNVPHGCSPVKTTQVLEEDMDSHGRSHVGDTQEEEKDIPSHGRSPVGDTQELEEDILSHGQTPVRGGDGHEGDKAVVLQREPSFLLLVASFTSGYPPTPGRGFRHDDDMRTSEEQEEHQDEQRPSRTHQSAEEALQARGVHPMLRLGTT